MANYDEYTSRDLQLHNDSSTHRRRSRLSRMQIPQKFRARIKHGTLGFNAYEYQLSIFRANLSKQLMVIEEKEEKNLEQELFSIEGLSCLQCLLTFSSGSHLEKHKYFCGNLFFIPGKTELLMENEAMLKEPESGMLICPWCPLLCSSMSVLQRHVLNCRDAKRNVKEIVKEFPCPECNNGYIMMQSLLSHLKSHYIGDIYCLPCKRHFSSKKSFSQHLTVCNRKMRFKCCDCRKKFLNAAALCQHLLSCNVGTQCLKCAEVIVDRENCTDHLSVHLTSEWLKMGLTMSEGVLYRLGKTNRLFQNRKDPSLVSPDAFGRRSWQEPSIGDGLKVPICPGKDVQTRPRKAKSIRKFVSKKLFRKHKTASSRRVNVNNTPLEVKSSVSDSDRPDPPAGSLSLNGTSNFVDGKATLHDTSAFDGLKSSADEVNFSVIENEVYEIENIVDDTDCTDEPLNETELSHSEQSTVQFNLVENPNVTDTTSLFTPAVNDDENSDGNELTLTVVNVEGGANLFNWDDISDNEDVHKTDVFYRQSETLNVSAINEGRSHDSSLNTETHSDGNEDGDSGIDAMEDRDSHQDRIEDLDVPPDTVLASHQMSSDKLVQTQEVVPVATSLKTTTVDNWSTDFDSSNLQLGGSKSAVSKTVNQTLLDEPTMPQTGYLMLDSADVISEVVISSNDDLPGDVFLSSSTCDMEVVVDSSPATRPYSASAEHSYALPSGQFQPKPKSEKPIHQKGVESKSDNSCRTSEEQLINKLGKPDVAEAELSSIANIKKSSLRAQNSSDKLKPARVLMDSTAKEKNCKSLSKKNKKYSCSQGHKLESDQKTRKAQESATPIRKLSESGLSKNGIAGGKISEGGVSASCSKPGRPSITGEEGNCGSKGLKFLAPSANVDMKSSDTNLCNIDPLQVILQTMSCEARKGEKMLTQSLLKVPLIPLRYAHLPVKNASHLSVDEDAPNIGLESEKSIVLKKLVPSAEKRIVSHNFTAVTSSKNLERENEAGAKAVAEQSQTETTALILPKSSNTSRTIERLHCDTSKCLTANNNSSEVDTESGNLSAQDKGTAAVTCTTNMKPLFSTGNVVTHQKAPQKSVTFQKAPTDNSNLSQAKEDFEKKRNRQIIFDRYLEKIKPRSTPSVLIRRQRSMLARGFQPMATPPSSREDQHRMKQSAKLSSPVVNSTPVSTLQALEGQGTTMKNTQSVNCSDISKLISTEKLKNEYFEAGMRQVITELKNVVKKISSMGNTKDQCLLFPSDASQPSCDSVVFKKGVEDVIFKYSSVLENPKNFTSVYASQLPSQALLDRENIFKAGMKELFSDLVTVLKMTSSDTLTDLKSSNITAWSGCEVFTKNLANNKDPIKASVIKVVENCGKWLREDKHVEMNPSTAKASSSAVPLIFVVSSEGTLLPHPTSNPQPTPLSVSSKENLPPPLVPIRYPLIVSECVESVKRIASVDRLTSGALLKHREHNGSKHMMPDSILLDVSQVPIKTADDKKCSSDSDPLVTGFGGSKSSSIHNPLMIVPRVDNKCLSDNGPLKSVFEDCKKSASDNLPVQAVDQITGNLSDRSSLEKESKVVKEKKDSKADLFEALQSTVPNLSPLKTLFEACKKSASDILPIQAVEQTIGSLSDRSSLEKQPKLEKGKRDLKSDLLKSLQSAVPNLGLYSVELMSSDEDSSEDDATESFSPVANATIPMDMNECVVSEKVGTIVADVPEVANLSSSCVFTDLEVSVSNDVPGPIEATSNISSDVTEEKGHDLEEIGQLDSIQEPFKIIEMELCGESSNSGEEFSPQVHCQQSDQDEVLPNSSTASKSFGTVSGPNVKSHNSLSDHVKEIHSAGSDSAPKEKAEDSNLKKIVGESNLIICRDVSKTVKAQKLRSEPYFRSMFTSRALMPGMKFFKRKLLGRDGLCRGSGARKFVCMHCSKCFYSKTDFECHICFEVVTRNKLTQNQLIEDAKDITVSPDISPANESVPSSNVKGANKCLPDSKPENDEKSPLETYLKMRTTVKKGRYTCDMCKMKLKNFSALLDHKFSAHNVKSSLQCHVCGKEFSRLQKLAVHFAKSHKPINPPPEGGKDIKASNLSAEKCPSLNGSKAESDDKVKCSQKRNLPKERRSAATIKNDTHQCESCEKSFTTSSGLRSHLNQAHRKLFKCPLCLRRFTYLKKLKLHCDLYHETLATVDFTSLEASTAEPTTAESSTAEPTTAEPTTAEPTTAEPTTAGPTTAGPTTAEPTTVESAIVEPPTTAEPKTGEPTVSPPITSNDSAEEKSFSFKKIRREECFPQKDSGSSPPKRKLCGSVNELNSVRKVATDSVTKEDYIMKRRKTTKWRIVKDSSDDESPVSKVATDNVTEEDFIMKRRKKTKWRIVKDSSDDESPEKSPRLSHENITPPELETSKPLILSLSKVKKSRYKCQYCDESFKKEHHLMQHKSKLHKDCSQWSCPVCEIYLSSSHQLQSHLKQCKGEIKQEESQFENNAACPMSAQDLLVPRNAQSDSLITNCKNVEPLATEKNSLEKIDLGNCSKAEEQPVDNNAEPIKKLSESKLDPESPPKRIELSAGHGSTPVAENVNPGFATNVSNSQGCDTNHEAKIALEGAMVTVGKEQVSSSVPSQPSSSKGKWKCDECQLEFNIRGYLMRHNIKVHGAPSKFNCSICNRIFVDRRSFRFHKISKHRKNQSPLQPDKAAASNSLDPENPLKVIEALTECSSPPVTESVSLDVGNNLPDCKESDTNKGIQTAAENETSVQSSTPVNEGSPVKEKTVRKCARCDKTFRRAIDLKRHRHRAHKRSMCKTCKLYFDSKQLLFTHLSQAHAETPFDSSATCSISPSQLTNGIDSKGNIAFMSDLEGSATQQECHEGKVLSNPGKLCSSDQLGGTPSKEDSNEPGTYKCEDCPLSYKLFSCLKRHRILMHAEPASHYCDVCGKGFSYPHSLKNHMRSHSWNQPKWKSKRSENVSPLKTRRSVKEDFKLEPATSPVALHSSSGDERVQDIQEKTHYPTFPLPQRCDEVQFADNHEQVDKKVEENCSTDPAAKDGVNGAEDDSFAFSRVEDNINLAKESAEVTGCWVPSNNQTLPKPVDTTLSSSVPASITTTNGLTMENQLAQPVPIMTLYPSASFAPPYPPIQSYPPMHVAPMYQTMSPMSSYLSVSPAPSSTTMPSFDQFRAYNACSLCGLCLPSWYALQEHYYTAHSSANYYSAPALPPAPHLAYSYTAPEESSVFQYKNQTYSDWPQPLQIPNAGNVSHNSVPEDGHSSFQELTSRSVAHCSVCGLCFPSLFALQEHYSTHMASQKNPSHVYNGFY